MLCCRPQSKEAKCLERILGHTKDMTMKEAIIFSHVLLCEGIAKEDLQLAFFANKKNEEYIDIWRQYPEKIVFEPLLPLPALISQQTYPRWKSTIDLNLNLWRWKKKKVIYIVPLQRMPNFVNQIKFNVELEFCEFLQRFIDCFFLGMSSQVLPEFDINGASWKVTKRIHSVTQQEQFLVSDINRNLHSILPKDGFCMLGVTWTDLYPTEDLNFVLGEANFVDRACVMSFGRFEPKAFMDGVNTRPVESMTPDLMWKLMKVMSHEICHIFGMAHCVFFKCLMNESNSVEEALSQPMFLCPVCLRKLQKVGHFDIEQRYKGILEFCEIVYTNYPCDALKEGIEWYKECLSLLSKA